jgi:hypothetical protein
MLVDGIEFEYQVVTIDIESAHMIVDYTPADDMLMPMTLNVPFVEFREFANDLTTGEQVEINANKTFEQHKEYSVKIAAPVSVWRRQRLLIENM